MQLIRQSTNILAIVFFIVSSCMLILQDKSMLHQFNSSTAADDIARVYSHPLPIPIPTVNFISDAKSTSTTDISNSVWLDIGKNLKLDDHVDNPRVQKQIRGILANKSELIKSLKDSGPYIYYIYSQIKARHLPAELALIPIIESDYDPYDHNSIGANGLWQFMPGTAKGLGIKITDGYDGRRSLIDSTNAALNYYTDLNKEFNGNWYLAIAAYNCGDGGVASAIRRAKSHDYWQLNLPLETKIYVPRLLALAEIIKNPQKYGIELPVIKNLPVFSSVQVNQSISLANYAKSHNLDLSVLQKLNPEYKNTNIAPKISNTLLVPMVNR